MFTSVRKHERILLRDLPCVGTEELHPEIRSLLRNSSKSNVYAYRKVVAYVAYTTQAEPCTVGRDRICNIELENSIYSSQNKFLILFARKLCRLLGNQTLFRIRKYTVHARVSEWIPNIPPSRRKPSVSHCMYFLTWCSKNVWFGTAPEEIPVGLLTRQVLSNYQQFLLQRVSRKQIKQLTASSYLGCVVSWLSWLKENQKIGPLDTSGLFIELGRSRERALPKHVHISKFLDIAHRYADTRHYVPFFLFLIWTGGRPIDIYDLQVRNINMEDQTLWLQSKRGPSRLFVVPINLWILLTKILHARGNLNSDDYVFTHPDGRKIDYDSIRKVFNKINLRSGSHIDGQMAFRHRFATDCLEQGVGEKMTMELLGQSDLSCLPIYQHVQTHFAQQLVNNVVYPWRDELQ